MGLDMYATTVKATHVGDKQIDIGVRKLFESDSAYKTAVDDGEVIEDFAYWRKFNNLHGWMEELYCSKGGQEEFNCVGVRLTLDDLEKLKTDCADLKPKAGFFFGQCEEMSPDDMADVLAFIKKAEEAIKDGNAVIYSSWW